MMRMMMMTTTMLALISFFCASAVSLISGTDWCYQSQVTCNGTCIGPDTWSVVSQQCSGRAQSPVNVVTRKTLQDKHLTPFQFIGYQDTFHGRIKNTGYTVQVELPANALVKGGNLSVPYKAVELHFHWGKDGGPGSEHTIDGEQFQMEMHIVHIKEEYNSLSQALGDSAGVAALGFFFQESATSNKHYDAIVTALQDITRPSTNTTLSAVSLSMLIPPLGNMTGYFRYHGSLTTPNCAEAIVWTLFDTPILLSRRQLAAFSKLRFSNGMQMERTYRPVQPLNERKVFYSGGHVALASAVLLTASVLISSQWRDS